MSHNQIKEHHFNVRHVEHLGLNASIIYSSIISPLTICTNHKFTTSIDKLIQIFPYFSKAEIIQNLLALEELTIIAINFLDNEKVTICLVNPMEEVFPDNEL